MKIRLCLPLVRVDPINLEITRVKVIELVPFFELYKFIENLIIFRWPEPAILSGASPFLQAVVPCWNNSLIS